MNNVSLIGRLTKEPEVRFTSSGVANVSFNFAVNRPYKNQQGEQETDFIRCVAWRNQAELLGKYFHKGSRLGLEGSIQTRNYENQQGQRVYVTEININKIHFIDTKAETQQLSNSQGQQQYQQQYQQQSNQSYQQQSYQQGNQGYPQQNQYGEPDYMKIERQQNNPFANDMERFEVTEEDLPF